MRRHYRLDVTSAMETSRVALALACSVLVVLLSAALGGCGGPEVPTDRRLLVVGIDSADWKVIDPLLEQGRLPNLGRLVARGVSCGLKSLDPPQKSPVIWTSIATGKEPTKHSVTDYVTPGSDKLMTSNMRTARTFWDIIGDEGTDCTVVGWLVSWPAEPVNGYMITDYFRIPPKADRPKTENLTYPDGLLAEVEGLRVAAESIAAEEFARFASPERALTKDEAKELPIEELFVEMREIETVDQMLSQLRLFVASDMTFLAASKYMMETHPTDVFVVYLRGVDSASHKFWSSANPDDSPLRVSQTYQRVFGETVNSYYEYADEMLGELIDAYGEGASVIVCSDHGFDGPQAGQKSGGINEHGTTGILVMAGEGIREGVRIEEPQVCDLTPTILALYGLPVADDMDGSVIEDAFEPGFLSGRSRERIATYELTATD
jgi:predicted AlkP superfamily phosphohydrolase/phosphomutase